MIKIIMDSGKEYEVDNDIESFTESMKNQLGITINGFKEIRKDIEINPCHISSIEEINEIEFKKQEIRLESIGAMKNLEGFSASETVIS